MRAWREIRILDRLGRWQGVPIALVLLAAMMVVRVIDPAPLETLRLRLFDQMQELKPRAWEPSPITIVDIDEESLRRYGQWPWPRSYLAALVDKIRRAGAPVIGFDLFFPEPDRLSPSRMLDNYAFSFADPDAGIPVDDALRDAIRALPSNDVRLADSLAKANVVVLGMAVLKKRKGGVPLPNFSRTAYREMGKVGAHALPEFDEVIHTIEEIAVAARGYGVITTVPERDGVVRRPPLAVRIDGEIYPSLSIEMLRIAFGKQWFVVAADDDGAVTGIGVPGVPLTRTASDGRIWLHFAEHQPKRYVSAADVLDGDVDPSRFQSKLVLIASTGLGLTDFVATPVEARMPGVEVHAQVLEAALYGVGLQRPNYMLWIELGMLLFAGVVVIALVPPIRPVWTPLPYGGLFVALLAASWIAYDHFRLLVDSSFIIICTGILYSVMLTTARAALERARKRLEAQLEKEREAAARLDGELSAARTIQMGILPREFPAFPERNEFKIFALIEPARAVGGDLYDFALIHDDHLFFMVGDVSGKGVPASLFMAITKALYKSAALRYGDAIDQIMSRANVEISRENPAMLFVTMVAGLLNLRTGELDICNAGHDAPLRLRAGDLPEALESEGGPPLCVLDDFAYPSDRYVLAPGDSVAVVTDGVTEAMNEAEELYGMERAVAVLGATEGTAQPDEIAQALYADVRRFTGAAERSDDTTIMVVRYDGPQVADDGTGLSAP